MQSNAAINSHSLREGKKMKCFVVGVVDRAIRELLDRSASAPAATHYGHVRKRHPRLAWGHGASGAKPHRATI